MRQQLVLWSLILGLWALLVFVFAGQLYLSGNLSWSEAALVSLRDWYAWLLLGPLVAWLALHFPLERQKLTFNIPVHICACIVSVFLYGLMVPRPPLRGGPGRGGPGGGGPQFRFRGGVPEQSAEQLRSAAAEKSPDPALEPRKHPPFSPGLEPGLRHIPEGPGMLFNRAAMNARFNVPIYCVIVSVVHALTYYRRSQERETKAVELEGRLLEAKLQSLRMQLHPHFLFNTLNAVSTLVHKDAQAADEMIGNLSELLRATLDSSQQEIPLRQELSLLDRYLEIQRARFGNRLQVEKRIDSAALHGLVPTLILQPLVENAIRHGIEPNPETGRVTVTAEIKGQTLHLEVLDNGRGLKTVRGQTAGGGIGLANTRARLEGLYGSAGQLSLCDAADGGCSVRVQLPFRHEN